MEFCIGISCSKCYRKMTVENEFHYNLVTFGKIQAYAKISLFLHCKLCSFENWNFLNFLIESHLFCCGSCIPNSITLFPDAFLATKQNICYLIVLQSYSFVSLQLEQKFNNLETRVSNLAGAIGNNSTSQKVTYI